ncbi:MAG: DegT/DnrJ/EryC1/StrS family aminotransferase [Kofleriaceae bacterium]|nr:DegT/DnrJ/EryC1/StrS family aminotransferase [Kofleriaceae bacterium]
MKVGLLDLQAQYAAIGPEIEAQVRRVLASGHYIMGEDVAALEREMAADANLPHAIAVSSGTDALLAALWALGIGPGDEVVTTAMSFFATAGAVARLGATPVFADIDPVTFNLSPASALARVTKRTKAIIPVHLFGRMADLAGLAPAKLPIIEDAAQAVGAPGLGEIGALVTLSFFPSKNLGAAGDAGMVLTRDAELADRTRLYRTHGSRPKYTHHVVGANLRMDTLQAAILRVKRPYLAGWNAKRRANALAYHELLAGTPLVLPHDEPGHVWHHFVVRAPRRDELRAFLREREIETEVYYPLPLHLQPCFPGGKDGDLPESERAAREVLALPVHPDLSPAQLEWVGTSVREFYARGGST